MIHVRGGGRSWRRICLLHGRRASFQFAGLLGAPLPAQELRVDFQDGGRVRRFRILCEKRILIERLGLVQVPLGLPDDCHPHQRETGMSRVNALRVWKVIHSLVKILPRDGGQPQAHQRACSFRTVPDYLYGSGIQILGRVVLMALALQTAGLMKPALCSTLFSPDQRGRLRGIFEGCVILLRTRHPNSAVDVGRHRFRFGLLSLHGRERRHDSHRQKRWRECRCAARCLSIMPESRMAGAGLPIETAAPWRPRPIRCSGGRSSSPLRPSRWLAYSNARSPVFALGHSVARSRSSRNSLQAIHAKGFHQ